ncbi:MAG: putative transporter permease protein [Phycisphaerales bacterium]|nr:putative transporter permease protein [Phycisphaerales bacterium]
MTTLADPFDPVARPAAEPAPPARRPSQSPWAQALRTPRVRVAGGVLLAVVLLCVGTLGWTVGGANPRYEANSSPLVRAGPAGDPAGWFGYDGLGRPLLVRCLLGGTISLAVGLASATISVVLGVTVGLVAGYRRGWVDAVLMRLVDVLYGLPYILLVILFKIAFEDPLARLMTRVFPESGKAAANLIVLFAAIGLVSWLTMARVVRGQVLSLRGQPFVEACKALGLPERRIFLRHILPNLVGPITVYATLTVPAAILQESFLSFLGIGVQPPLPTWGSLASDAVQELSPTKLYWWMLTFPCLLLVVTLLSLNFLGDGLRDVFDPKKEAAKV